MPPLVRRSNWGTVIAVVGLVVSLAAVLILLAHSCGGGPAPQEADLSAVNAQHDAALAAVREAYEARVGALEAHLQELSEEIARLDLVDQRLAAERAADQQALDAAVTMEDVDKIIYRAQKKLPVAAPETPQPEPMTPVERDGAGLTLPRPTILGPGDRAGEELRCFGDGAWRRVGQVVVDCRWAAQRVGPLVLKNGKIAEEVAVLRALNDEHVRHVAVLDKAVAFKGDLFDREHAMRLADGADYRRQRRLLLISGGVSLVANIVMGIALGVR